MSRKQDQRLVEAYERLIKGESLDEADKKYAKQLKMASKQLGISEKEVLKLWKTKKAHFAGTHPHRYEEGECVYCARPEGFNESKYTIYVDKNKKGQETYTVYQGDKHVGEYLSDDPTLKKYMKQGKVKPGIHEAKKGREFTASLAKWAAQRAKDVAKGVKFLEDAVKKKSANDILSSINGIESHLDVMKKSMSTVSEEELNEMGMVIGTPLSRRRDATPTPQIDEAKWSNDPFGYKRELAERISNVARFIQGIHVSDRYYPGVDHDKKLKARIDKAFTSLTKAVDALEKAMDKNKGI